MDAQTYRQACLRELQREQAAQMLHQQTTVVLGYNNIPLDIQPDGFDPAPILGRGSLCATSLHRLSLGGVKVIVWSPGIPFWLPSGEGLAGRAKVRFIQQQLEALHTLPRLTDGQFQIARNAADIRRINAEAGIAILLHLSGVHHLNDLGILREYYDLGVRMIHCGFQDWPDEPPASDTIRYTDPVRQLYHGTALNAHGARTIEEMKRLGIIVDVAHLLPEGFDDVASRMEGIPFVYSHGGCAALYVNPRTFDDGRIARLAASRGVYGIGVCLGPDLQDDLAAADPDYPRYHRRIAEGRKRREAEMAATARDVRDFVRMRYGQWDGWEERELGRIRGYVAKPSLSTVVAHMAHLRETFGPDIVGYGPDYEATFQYVRGLEEADKTPNLTRALLDAGFTPADTQAAMGHNFMRVYEAVLR
jgi:membrane dipeptidase